MSTFTRAVIAASLLGGCDPATPVAAAPAPAKLELVPFPGMTAEYLPTTLHVRAEPVRLAAKSDAAWPAHGVWSRRMLAKRLGALEADWFDGDAARQRIIADDFPKLREQLGVI